MGVLSNPECRKVSQVIPNIQQDARERTLPSLFLRVWMVVICPVGTPESLVLREEWDTQNRTMGAQQLCFFTSLPS